MTTCDSCGHAESDHARDGWCAGRCLAYPGGCDCDGFAVSDYDAFGMAPRESWDSDA